MYSGILSLSYHSPKKAWTASFSASAPFAGSIRSAKVTSLRRVVLKSRSSRTATNGSINALLSSSLGARSPNLARQPSFQASSRVEVKSWSTASPAASSPFTDHDWSSSGVARASSPGRTPRDWRTSKPINGERAARSCRIAKTPMVGCIRYAYCRPERYVQTECQPTEGSADHHEAGTHPSFAVRMVANLALVKDVHEGVGAMDNIRAKQ